MKFNAAIAAFAKTAGRDYILGLHLPRGERLYHFIRETRLCPDIKPQPGKEMCRELEATHPQFGTDLQQRKLYLAPRSTFKTSIAQANFIYLALLYPNIRMLLVRATHNDAIVVLRSIMQSLSSNAVVVANWCDFSKTALVWTEGAITIGSRNNREMALKEPTIDTAGIGVSKTGYHPDYVWLDDIVHENNYRSAKAREDGRLTIDDTVSPVLETHGSMVVTGTFWSENDTYSWIIEQEAATSARARRSAAGSLPRAAASGRTTSGRPTTLAMARRATTRTATRSSYSLPSGWDGRSSRSRSRLSTSSCTRHGSRTERRSSPPDISGRSTCSISRRCTFPIRRRRWSSRRVWSFR